MQSQHLTNTPHNRYTCAFLACLSVCGPLGVEDRNTVQDDRMTASTFYDSSYHPYYGRLNGSRGLGAWCTKTKTNRKDYLQVDMGAVYCVCAVATQGYRSGSAWTTSYKVHLSTDGVIWNAYMKNNKEKVYHSKSVDSLKARSTGRDS